MALNATIGATDSNSYVTLSEADAYFEDRMHSSSWDAITDQEPFLISASQMLDWYINWKGFKTSDTQFMLWPRKDVVRRNGTTVANNIIPNEIKTAVFELTISSLENDRLEDNPMAGIDQLKVSSLVIKASVGGVDSTAKNVIPEKVYKILSDLYTLGGMSVVRLMRG